MRSPNERRTVECLDVEIIVGDFDASDWQPVERDTWCNTCCDTGFEINCRMHRISNDSCDECPTCVSCDQRIADGNHEQKAYTAVGDYMCTHCYEWHTEGRFN